MHVTLLFLASFSYFISGAANNSLCSSNKCYQTVWNLHRNLSDLIHNLNSTSKSANYSQIFNIEKIQNDIKDTKVIGNEIRNITSNWQTYKDKTELINLNVTKNLKVTAEMMQKLESLQEYNKTVQNISAKATEILNELKNKQAIFKEEVDKCKKVSNKYTEFKKIVDELIKDHDNVTKRYNSLNNKSNQLNKKIKQNFEETIQTKRNFDKLELPTNLVHDYFNKTENEFNKIIRTLRENIDLLKELLDVLKQKLTDDLKNKEKKLLEYIQKIQDNVNKMSDDLKKYESELALTEIFQKTVNNESRELLAELKKSLERGVYRKILAEIREKRALLKIYKTILDAVPINEKLNMIKKRIDRLKKGILLIQQWQYLNTEIKRLRENKKEIEKIICTALITTGLRT